MSVNPLDSNTDVVSHVLAFCPLHTFLYMASVSKGWRAAWVTSCGRAKNTGVSMAATTPARTKWVVDDAGFWLSAGGHASMPSAKKNTVASCNSNSCSRVNIATTTTTTTTTTLNSAVPLTTATTTTTTTTSTNSTGKSDNGKNNIFCMTAAAGNLFGLKMAVVKLGAINDARSSGSSVAQEDRTSSESSRSSKSSGKGGGKSRHSNDDNNSNMATFAQRRVPEIAAEIGHLEMLEWAVRQQGYPLSPSAFCFAAKSGSLQVLEWLVAQGCPRDLYGCTMGAASGGSLEALKWSRRRGHGWDRFVCFSAASRGDLKMLMWARGQGCPWDRHQCAHVAELHEHQVVVKWVNDQA